MVRTSSSPSVFRFARSKARSARGFTLIELLVVITIIGMLMSMLLPAVNAVRIAMQKTTCKNNLKNFGIACKNFKMQHEHYPGGGWGYKWTGDGNTNRGYGKKQPGGWTFAILSDLDAGDVFEESQDMDDATRKAAATKHIQQPWEVFLCPSRRDVRSYPILPANMPINCNSLTAAARCDYAMNAGSQPYVSGTISGCQFDGGPTKVEDGDNPAWWNSGNDPKLQDMQGKPRTPKYDTSKFTGVSYIYSTVRTIDDGETYTYLIGEKFMDPTKYTTGDDPGDTHALFSGFGNDTYRTGATPPLKDRVPDPSDSNCRFGGPHDDYFHVVMCDGTTRPVSYDINPEIHRLLSGRNDGNIKTDGQPMADSDF